MIAPHLGAGSRSLASGEDKLIMQGSVSPITGRDRIDFQELEYEL
jgi:hypothetical protein